MDEPVFKARGGAQFRKKRVERDDSSEEPEAGGDNEKGGGELDETAAAIERVRNSQRERQASSSMKKAMMKKKLKEELALQVDDNDEMVVRLREAEQFDPSKWYCIATRKSLIPFFKKLNWFLVDLSLFFFLFIRYPGILFSRIIACRHTLRISP